MHVHAVQASPSSRVRRDRVQKRGSLGTENSEDVPNLSAEVPPPADFAYIPTLNVMSKLNDRASRAREALTPPAKCVTRGSRAASACSTKPALSAHLASKRPVHLG